MSGLLARICADKADHVAARKAARPLGEVEAAAAEAEPPRGFARALDRAVAASGTGLIAEIKKASPSEGLIRADFDPPTLARAYANGGAACLSVLTDTPYFQGSDDYIAAARTAVALPLLRKDFLIEPYQVAESRALGADAVLIIMAAVDDGAAAELLDASRQWGMDALVEAHDEPELDRALKLGGALIGINNRNLRTLAVDLRTTLRLAPRVPPEAAVVCESGLSRPTDLARMRAGGVHRFLVGTTLMAQADVAEATAALLARAPAPERSPALT